LKFGRAELTNAHRGDWTGLNFAYTVIIEERIKKWKKLQSSNQVRLNITQ